MLLDFYWVRLWDGVWHCAADWVWDWVWYADWYAAWHINGVWTVDGDWDWVWYADWDGSWHGHWDGMGHGHWHVTGNWHGVRLWHRDWNHLVGLAHFDWYCVGCVSRTVAGRQTGAVAGRQTVSRTVAGGQTVTGTVAGRESRVRRWETERQIGATFGSGLGVSGFDCIGYAEPDQCQTDDACLKKVKSFV